MRPPRPRAANPLRCGRMRIRTSTRTPSIRPARGFRPAGLLACLAVLAAVAGPARAEEPAKEPARLAPDAFRVFKVDRPITGRFEFDDPVGGKRLELQIRETKPGGKELSGTLLPDGKEVLSLTARSDGLGYDGVVRELLSACGQDRVAVTDFLPLGDQIILRMDARPPEAPCPFLEDARTATLVVAPAPRPVRLLAPGDISSPASRSQLGLEGQPGGPSSPIVADTVMVEGGTEMKFVGRTRGLDGSVWIEVQAIVSPAPGVEPPRGYLKPDQLRVAASLTLFRAGDR